MTDHAQKLADAARAAIDQWKTDTQWNGEEPPVIVNVRKILTAYETSQEENQPERGETGDKAPDNAEPIPNGLLSDRVKALEEFEDVMVPEKHKEFPDHFDRDDLVSVGMWVRRHKETIRKVLQESEPVSNPYKLLEANKKAMDDMPIGAWNGGEWNIWIEQHFHAIRTALQAQPPEEVTHDELF